MAKSHASEIEYYLKDTGSRGEPRMLGRYTTGLEGREGEALKVLRY